MSTFSSIPADSKIASNELAFAIRDKFPVSDGHTLVIPHREIADWWDATPAERQCLFDLVDEVRAGLLETHSPEGFNIGFNSGAAAGQTIEHLHIHVIPRYRGDMADPRGGVRHVIPERGNYLSPGAESEDRLSLYSTRDDRFYRELSRLLQDHAYDRFDLIVSFVMYSGVQLISSHIDEALRRGVAIRILTTDYLLVTHPQALAHLLDRVGDAGGAGGRLEVKVFSGGSQSFHPKAYIFTSSAQAEGVALLGSSNLSLSGIRKGIEWNVRSEKVSELTDEFGRHWSDRRSVELTQTWLTEYRGRFEARPKIDQVNGDPVTVAGSDMVDAPLQPVAANVIQREALAALEATRIEGHRAGLVVMATGLGKTWLAGFDSSRPEFKRVLFVAHRDEILSQSRDVFRRIRPDGSFTIFAGGNRDHSGTVVFAGVQLLHRHLDKFDPDEFDYIVIDEFHHAAAATYRKVIGHFRPKFLLGLTATPDRADSADLMALCGDNLVFQRDLRQGIAAGLLAPFRYRAIKDVADYAEIPWRNGRFDIDELSTRLETGQRAQQVFDEWEQMGGGSRKALGFCCSIRHADFMAAFFADKGVSAVSVHSGESSAPRIDALDRLRTGEVSVIFAVDLFNEGVDVPAIDLVMMVRPTESGIVFLQQLGRGLRVSEGKAALEVLDLVGNHKGFLQKASMLVALTGAPEGSDRKAVARLREGLTDLPEGCEIVVEVEAIDLLEKMLGAPRKADLYAQAIADWMDSHGGARPTALELSLRLGTALELKASGGWFGLLRDLNLLGDDELRASGTGADFLLDIEFGAYNKSYKLVILAVLLNMGAMRSKASLREIALGARWEIFSDPRLTADLVDAQSAFVDMWDPTELEWTAYWRKNPIAALSSGTKSSQQWFDFEDEKLALKISVASPDGEAFDRLVREMVDYRLHRYLAQRKTRDLGHARKPVDIGGGEIDATFRVLTVRNGGASILFESAGGTKDSDAARNTEYVRGLDAILSRMKDLELVLVDAYVDSGRVQELPVADRRLEVAPLTYPINLDSVEDLVALRAVMLRASATVGRAPGVKNGGGNSRKAIRLMVKGLEGQWPNAKLADQLAGLMGFHGDGRSPAGSVGDLSRNF
jgi:superfamily II DNA or RNA helicase/diadenosine tetraphosphate (Ap4A) HIT family hydrolase/HKD family nuclease